MKVQQFLAGQGKPFEVIEHPSTYTASHMAQAVHVAGDLVAKTVVAKADDQYVLLILPATCRVDLDSAREALGAECLELAEEREFARLFPDCELGAVPPFGSQFGMKSIVDTALTEADQIVFEGNTLREAIRMSYRDFAELEHPIVISFAVHL